jgi:phosphoribosylformylglycinamidine synthase
VAPPAPRVESEKDWFRFAPEATNLTPRFLRLLASPALASKRWITEQYDTSVRTNTLAGPGASDAAVVRIKDPKTNEVKRALALSTDGNGRWCQLHPRLAAMHAVAEAARNVAASGARPVAATNCLNFGSPEKPEVMWQFSQVIDGIAEASTALGTPITGGNVSFYNETLGKSIYPTPVIGMLGILDDVSRVLEIAFRNQGDVILLLDGSNADTRARDFSSAAFSREFSSSEYSKIVGGIVAGEPPAIELDAEMRLIDCLVALASEGAVGSAHDLSDGGLALAVAECCFASSSRVGARHAASPLGANVSVDDPAPAEYALFSERGARAIVSVSPENLAAVLTIARQYGVAASEIGRVTGGDAFRVEQRGQAVVECAVETLRDAWANSLEQWLGIRK